MLLSISHLAIIGRRRTLTKMAAITTGTNTNIASNVPSKVNSFIFPRVFLKLPWLG